MKVGSSTCSGGKMQEMSKEVGRQMLKTTLETWSPEEFCSVIRLLSLKHF